MICLEMTLAIGADQPSLRAASVVTNNEQFSLIIGSTIVHVLDFTSGDAYTAVTPAKGEFMRMRGRIEIKSCRPRP